MSVYKITSIDRVRESDEQVITPNDAKLMSRAAAAVERYRKEKEQQRACEYANEYDRIHTLLQGWAYQRRIRVHRTSKGHIHYQGIKFMDLEGKQIGQSQAWDTVDDTIVRQSKELGTTTIILLMLNQLLPNLPEFKNIELPTTEKEYHIFEIYLDNRDLYDNFD